MNINFDYKKKNLNYVSGHIFKGRDYRCSYIRYKSLYRNPAPGTEVVQLYNYQPKDEVRASSMILHGLGSRNIKFLLWLGPHLASAGVNTTILILPGNYTRVENNSVSGKSFLYPRIDVLYQFWEHAVVDVLTTIDLMKEKKLWLENNILTGYCLGGMISSIVSALRSEIGHTLFMTTGGHIPKILHESPTTRFARKMFETNSNFEFLINDKEKLYEVYKSDISKIEQMNFEDFLKDRKLHPLLKIDPIAYGHFLDDSKLTIVDAIFDATLPVDSRKGFYNTIPNAKKRVVPISHVSWLPFSYFLGKYILHKVSITDKKSRKKLLKTEIVENPLEK